MLGALVVPQGLAFDLGAINLFDGPQLENAPEPLALETAKVPLHGRPLIADHASAELSVVPGPVSFVADHLSNTPICVGLPTSGSSSPIGKKRTA